MQGVPCPWGQCFQHPHCRERGARAPTGASPACLRQLSEPCLAPRLQPCHRLGAGDAVSPDAAGTRVPSQGPAATAGHQVAMDLFLETINNCSDLSARHYCWRRASCSWGCGALRRCSTAISRPRHRGDSPGLAHLWQPSTAPPLRGGPRQGIALLLLPLRHPSIPGAAPCLAPMRDPSSIGGCQHPGTSERLRGRRCSPQQAAALTWHRMGKSRHSSQLAK